MARQSEPSFFFRYDESELLEAREKLQLINTNKDRLPADLKAGYFDVVIVYSHEDKQKAENYCQSLRDLQLKTGKTIKATLYDDEMFSDIKRTRFGRLEEVFKRCMCIFVYLTQHVCTLFESDILLSGILEKEVKRLRVVPIYTTAPRSMNFKIPWTVRGLKGLQFYLNDELYRKGLCKLIGRGLEKREDKEETLFHKQYEKILKLTRICDMQQQGSWHVECAQRKPEANCTELDSNQLVDRLTSRDTRVAENEQHVHLSKQPKLKEKSDESAVSTLSLHSAHFIMTGEHKEMSNKHRTGLLQAKEPDFFSCYNDLELFRAREKLRLISKYFDRFPLDLKQEYFDVMVVYSQEDREQSEMYCQSLRDLRLESGRKVKVVLCDVKTLKETQHHKSGCLEGSFKQCMCTFVYLTQNFCTLMDQDDYLNEILEDQIMRQCLVPVHTVNPKHANFNIPGVLDIMKGIDFYQNDEYYRRRLGNFIDDLIKKREQKEKVLFEKQFEEASRFAEMEKEPAEIQTSKGLKRQRLEESAKQLHKTINDNTASSDSEMETVNLDEQFQTQHETECSKDQMECIPLSTL